MVPTNLGGQSTCKQGGWRGDWTPDHHQRMRARTATRAAVFSNMIGVFGFSFDLALSPGCCNALKCVNVQQFLQIDVETFRNGDWHIVVGGNIYVSFQMSMSSVYCILLRRRITEVER